MAHSLDDLISFNRGSVKPSYAMGPQRLYYLPLTWIVSYRLKLFSSLAEPEPASALIKTVVMITYPPIRFRCKVSGRELTAEVVTEAVRPGQYNFNTRFSDGFCDTFFHDERSNTWAAGKDERSAYLEKIQDDLSVLRKYQVGRHYLSFRHKVNGRTINIWVFETQRVDGYMMYSMGGCKCYSVFYNGDYRFEIQKINGAWQGKTVRHANPETIDQVLVAKIGTMIDARIHE
jgi:hypothetical protein